MANITKVYLMNTLLEKDYAHTMYFASESAQRSYFQGRIQSAMTFTDFSYQRKDNVIRIQKHIDSLYAAKVNYCMYQNAEYSNKWFYAFITDMKYVHDELTEVYIKTDVMQTWMFDITVKHSFVEREHTKDDTLGANTVDEGLETGDYCVNIRQTLSYGKDLCIIVGVTKHPDGSVGGGNTYNGVYSGLSYYKFLNLYTGAMEIDHFIKEYDGDAAGDAIVCMFMAPKDLALDLDGGFTSGAQLVNTPQPRRVLVNGFGEQIKTVDAEITADFTVQNKIDGYTPVNKKLLCYPYRYLLVTNNAGSSAIYRFEKFAKNYGDGEKLNIVPSFMISGCITPGCSIKLDPQHYNGAQNNVDEGLVMGKFPILSWTSDIYTNWLTQNSVNIGLNVGVGALQVVGGIIGLAASAYTGGMSGVAGAGMITSGVSQITGTLTQIHEQSMVPPQSKGNINSGDVVAADEENTFNFYNMSVKAEYAKIIDEYFNMFGYKCNRVKIPEKAHRENYWYTKTIDANIIGGIPQDDLQAIKDCYNRGITFWRNESNFRNYSVSNDIV